MIEDCISRLLKLPYAGARSGIYSAEVQSYRRKDFRNLLGKIPERVEVISEGMLCYSRAGVHKCKIKIQNDLNAIFQKEMEEAKKRLMDMGFAIKNHLCIDWLGGGQTRVEMEKGPLVVNIRYTDGDKVLQQKTSPILGKPKRIVGKVARLDYSIDSVPLTQDGKTAVSEIESVLKDCFEM